MEKECVLIDFNRDLNDLVALDKRLQNYELKPIYESAIQLLPSKNGDMSHVNDQQGKIRRPSRSTNTLEFIEYPRYKYGCIGNSLHPIQTWYNVVRF